jgi:hypothetical protein
MTSSMPGSGLDTVTAGAGTDTINLSGDIDVVTLNKTAATVTSGQGADTIAVNCGKDNRTVSGWNSVATIGGVATVSITDLDDALRINVASATQTDTLTGVGTSDPHGVFDLKNGVDGGNRRGAAWRRPRGRRARAWLDGIDRLRECRADPASRLELHDWMTPRKGHHRHRPSAIATPNASRLP